MGAGEKRGGGGGAGAGAGGAGGAAFGAGAGALTRSPFAPFAAGGAGGPSGLVVPSPLAAMALVGLFVLAFYRLTSCPGLPTFQFKTGLPEPTYLLLLPGNASSLPPPYALQQLPADDGERLIDVQPFSFRSPGPAPQRACGATAADAPLLLVLVHSAPANADKRRAIRDTWGSLAAAPPGRRAPEPRLRVLFLLGEVDDPKQQRLLDKENQRNGDLVQGSFRDSYRNMTYKHVMALKWTAYHCPGARYLLKTDDDVFANTPELLHFLSRELSPWGARKLILCTPFPYGFVKRSWRSKWRVSPHEYPGKLYPRYCAGWAVLYSPDAVFLLYREAQRSPYFWIDDVHVTGTLAARANLTQTPLGHLALSKAQLNSILEWPPQAEPPPFALHFLFGTPDMDRIHLYRLWDKVQKYHS